MKAEIQTLIEAALAQLQTEGVIQTMATASVQVDRPKQAGHGDLTTNIALMLAKPNKIAPRDLGQAIMAAIADNDLIQKTEIAGPGFINFFLNQSASHGVIVDILKLGERYGSNIEALKPDNGRGTNSADREQITQATQATQANKKVQVEFVSANPTGPLHVGHGRGAAVGDSLCRLLRSQGWQVSAEFYYNDAGQQISNLAKSVQARCRGFEPGDERWPADGYQGDYIIDVATAFCAKQTVEAADRVVKASGDIENLDDIRDFAVACLRLEQDEDLKAFGVGFDQYFLESKLYADGCVDDVVERLIDNGQAYEHDNALWLKTTAFGDDKDRVMRKRDGNYTYFVPDVAYHRDKWQRGFTRVINEQGADHHSTVTRVRAGLQALDIGIPTGWPEYVLHQMVRVEQGGVEVKLSKRAGSYLTLRDLIDEVGRDATRYFLVSRKADSQLTFDIDLAKSQSNDNPVYYIQYAHARICSVESKYEQSRSQTIEQLAKATDLQLALLDQDIERNIIKKMTHYPELLSHAAEKLEPQMIAIYLRELAGDFHSYYNGNKVLVDDVALSDARMAMSAAVKIVLRNGLAILGVSAPVQM